MIQPAFLPRSADKVPLAATGLTVSSANAEYPASNLKTSRLSDVWRSVDGVLSNVDIYVDFVTAQSISGLILKNHNLSSTATIAIAAGTTTAYANFSTTMTWRQFDAWKYLSTPQSYRHWRCRITDASNLDNFIQAGAFSLGALTVLTLKQCFASGWKAADEYNNFEQQTEWGVDHIDEGFYRMLYDLTFEQKDASETAVLRTIYRDMKKNIDPIFFIPDINGTDGHEGKFVNAFSRDRREGDTFVMQFREVSRGMTIPA